jgi:hypothetical protein
MKSQEIRAKYEELTGKKPPKSERPNQLKKEPETDQPIEREIFGKHHLPAELVLYILM